MPENIMIPVQIRRVKDPDGRERLKATVPMNLVFEKDFDAIWLEEELKKLEKRYFNLVDRLKHLLELLRSKRQKKQRVLLYWEFGDEIIRFVEQNKDSPLFLEGLTRSLVRDIEFSDKMIQRCKRFRLLYPDASKIDRSKSFNSYVATFEGGYISKTRRRKKHQRR